MDIKTDGINAQQRMEEWCPEHITTGVAAEFCGVSKVTVLRWIQRGYLVAFRLPEGHYRIRREDFADFLREHGIPPIHQGTTNADKEGD